MPPVLAVAIAAVVPHIAMLVVAGETVGIVGTNELGPTVPTMGDTLSVGTAAAELTPRLLISMAPSGIPVRAKPPGTVGDVDAAEVDVGIDDAAMLLEPEPHIPDIPDVSTMGEVVDIPGEVNGDAAVVPAVAPVAGVADPIPPPSYMAFDPYIPEGKVPTVVQPVPLPGVVIVPLAVGAGLTPGEVISVAPNGIPVGPTEELVVMPSGEVAPMAGVVAIGLGCA
jgi:hypothetical protein